MKKVKNIIFILFILFTTNSFAQQVLDQIVAIVDDDVILESQITQAAYYIGMQTGVDPVKNPKQFEVLKANALENLINQSLLLIQAEKDTIEADQRQVDNYLQQDMQRIIQQVGGEEKIEEALGMPMSKFRRTRREEIEKDLRVNAVRDQKLANIKVSRREVEQFFKAHKDSIGSARESVDISHILITTKPGQKAKEDTYQKIKEIRKMIMDGQDFSELASKYSEDPGSAANKGDLGFVSRTTLVREYAEAALKLNPGEISDIVESQFGYHIIRLEEKRGEKIHTSHILLTIKPSKEDDIATAEKIKEIYSKLIDGADFNEMVKEYSEDESTNQQNGHLGNFEVDQLKGMAKEFVYALRGVEPGHYSEPIKTQYGFHILKLNAKNDSRQYSLDTDWDLIENMALEYKRQKELQKWVKNIKEQVFVEIKDPYNK